MDALYSVMQGLESRLGGGEGVEGIYGSITATGMHKVLECMRHNCGLSKSSTLVDIGAGLGRPLLHALLLHGVAHGYGVELDKVKVAKAEAFCKGVLEELLQRGVISSDTSALTPSTAASKLASSNGEKQLNTSDVAALADQLHQQQHQQNDESVGSQSKQQAGNSSASSSLQNTCTGTALQDQSQVSCTSAAASTCAGAGEGSSGATPKGANKKQKEHLSTPQSTPIITCASIEQIASLEPATHAYSFWEGVPGSGKRAFGHLFRTARTLKAVAVVQRAIRGEAPEAHMAGLGFGPLLLIKAFPVKMSGSGRSFQAYVFSKPAGPSVHLLMRCRGRQLQQDAGVQLSPIAASKHHADLLLEPGLASACKPKRQQQQQQQHIAAAGDSPTSDGSPQQVQQLVQLRTEEHLVMQQQEMSSPGKRPQQVGAATDEEGMKDGEAGSPAKKQRGSDEAAAGAVESRYSLRPRQLSYCSSGLSSGSAGGGSSRSRITAASCSAATTGAATVAAAVAKTRHCTRGSKATDGTGGSKSIASGSTVNSNARSGGNSTAGSGSCSRAARGRKASSAAVTAPNAVAGGLAAKGSTARGAKNLQQQQQQAAPRARALGQQQTVAVVKQQQLCVEDVPDVSEARKAVSALGVTSTSTS